MARAIDWASVFSGRGDRRLEPVATRVDDIPSIVSLGVTKRQLRAPAGAFSDYRISRVLTTYLAGAGWKAGGDFDRLPLPFRAVATDLASGDRVVLGRGDLTRAVRASMSLPVILPPTDVDGRLLVDGGLVDNVPSEIPREMGADVVIAVDVGAPPRELTEEADVLTVVNRMTDLMMATGNRTFEDHSDVYLRPRLDGFESRDFARFEELIARGREVALQAMPQIEPLLCGRRGTPRPVDSGGALQPRGMVTRVEVKGLRRVSERLVTRRLRAVPGTEFDLAKAQQGLDAVWASNLFSSAWLEVKEAAEGGIHLVVGVRERPVLRAGVGVSYDEADNVRGFLRLRNGNLLGLGERLDLRAVVDSGRAAFEGTMGSANLVGSPFGYRIGVRIAEDKPKVYDPEGNEVGRTRFRQQRFFAAAQRQVGRDALVEVGAAGGRSQVDERNGIPFPEQTDTVVKSGVRLVFDNLDNRFFPGSGVRFDGRGERSMESLGATLGYWRLFGRADGYLRAGRVVLEGHVFGGGSEGDDVPVYDLYRVGGPVLVPGRAREEIWGSWAGAASVGIGFRPSPRWQIMMRAGAGNAWASREEVSFSTLHAGASLGVALSTAVGPLEVNLGVGAGRLRVYVALGFQ